MGAFNQILAIKIQFVNTFFDYFFLFFIFLGVQPEGCRAVVNRALTVSTLRASIPDAFFFLFFLFLSFLNAARSLCRALYNKDRKIQGAKNFTS